MNAVEVVQDFLVKGSELLVQADRAVIFCFGAFYLVGTAGTVLALVEFLRSAKAVSADRNRTQKMEFLTIGTDQIAVPVHLEIDCPEGIIPVFFVGSLFSVCGKLHIFFHEPLDILGQLII